MSMNNLHKIISNFMAKRQITVFGTDSTEKLSDISQNQSADRLLKGAKSFICFARVVPAAVYNTEKYSLETIWRSQNLLYRKLDTDALELAALLEESGYSALPNFGCCPMDINKNRDVEGYINQLILGEISGIGFIGKNRLLINSAYGPRMMLGSVITDAEIGKYCSIEPQNGKCPPDCTKCIDICPVKALDKSGMKIDIMKCLFHTACVPFLPKIRFLLLRKFLPKSAARLLNTRTFDEHTFHICSRCISICPIGVHSHD